jgi:hypothetical protein
MLGLQGYLTSKSATRQHFGKLDAQSSVNLGCGQNWAGHKVSLVKIRVNVVHGFSTPINEIALS